MIFEAPKKLRKISDIRIVHHSPDKVVYDKEITGARKQSMIDKNEYLRRENNIRNEKMNANSKSEGRVIRTREGLTIKGTKVFD